MDQNNELFDFLSEESDRLLGESDSDVWQITPVGLEEFIKEHLRLPPLTGRQYQDMITFLGDDPKKVFPRIREDVGSIFNLFCWLAGKGSGKDYGASIIVCYLFYLMLCMRNPQEYFNKPTGEAIDIVIVSYSEPQALLISFDKIKQRFKNWWWLKQHYSILWSEKYVTPKGKPEIEIQNKMIRSHNNVRIMCEHSANESYEGYNIIFFVMSEASAFKALTKERNGQKVFSTLKTSASSRFPFQWKGMVMSFPRLDEDTDFTCLLYQKSVIEGKDEETGRRIFGSKGATWDYVPSHYYSGHTFDFEGHQVPIELKTEFDEDPQECKAKYMCEPGKTGSKVVPEEIILRAVHDREPLLIFENSLEQGKMQVIVHGLENRILFTERYVITVDLGEVTSAAAIAVQHLDIHHGYVLDAIGAWTPDSKLGITVDLENVRDVLIQIGKTLPQPLIAFDQWQSRLMRLDLKRAGIKTAEYHTYERDYKDFKRGMALGVAKIVKFPALMTQLKALTEIKGSIMVDTRISKRKDLVDVAVGGFKLIMEGVKTAGLPGYSISENLSEFGEVLYGSV